MSEGISGYSTSSAAPSGLATAFDQDLRRRYSGGHLQQKAPSHSDMEDTDATPSPPLRRSDSTETLPKLDKLGVQSPSFKNVDPALRSPGMQSESSESQTDKAQESWVENVRLIEALRHFVREKLERGDFAADEDEDESKMEEDSEAKSLYPVLREVQGDNDNDTVMKME